MKKFAQRLTFVLVLFGLVAAATFVGNLGYQKYTSWRFGDYVCDYADQVERRAAYTAYKLAKPHMSGQEQVVYEERLVKLEDKFQHPYRTAIHNLSDLNFPSGSSDSFDKVLTDISLSLERESSPGKEFWDLCRTNGDVGCIAWPFILEDLGFPRADGSSRTISYEEYLTWKAKFEPVEKEMNTLLAMYE